MLAVLILVSSGHSQHRRPGRKQEYDRAKDRAKKEAYKDNNLRARLLVARDRDRTNSRFGARTHVKGSAAIRTHNCAVRNRKCASASGAARARIVARLWLIARRSSAAMLKQALTQTGSDKTP